MKKYKRWSIEKKNQIVKEYLNGARAVDLLKRHGIKSDSMLNRWVNQFKEYGTTIDGRGRKSTGRKKKDRLNPEEMTRDELIEYVKAVEDIKKFLDSQKK